MAGLLAWAADVVGGSEHSDEEEENEQRLRDIVPAFTSEQQLRAVELDGRAAALRRAIEELRLRIPPEHIAQRLPHLHAHSVASNAALALQLNAHSTTREEAQHRELILQEENAAYEKAISSCQKKIQEKAYEANLLQNKLKEMDLIEKDLKDEMEKALATVDFSQSVVSSDDSKIIKNSDLDKENPRSVKLKELEDKKQELSLMEEMVQNLENQWSTLQHESVKKPSPAQREKLLEKQLHSLVEQLTAKQAQAEGLIREIRAKESEFERLNGLRRRFESVSTDMNNTRTRYGRSISGASNSDYALETHRRPPNNAGGRTENQRRLMLMRSAFVLYILALHVLVFIKLSF